MHTSLETLPALVQVTAQTHIGMVEAALPGLLAGYYLVGSAALGVFHAGRSDVDFVAVTGRGLRAEELERLKGIHALMHNKKLLAGLDGLYVPTEALAAGPAAGALCARFNDGRFHGMQCFDPASIEAVVLKQSGIALMGAEPASLPYAIDWEEVLKKQRDNANTYWRKWAAACRSPLSPWLYGLYLRLGTVEWGVLGISRIYFTLRERDVASKEQAGRYTLEAMPERWHRIIREALRLRMPEIGPQYKSMLDRRRDALEYINYVIACTASNVADGFRYGRSPK